MANPLVTPLVLALIVAGCASEPERQMERRLEQTATVLAERTDADSLAAAGVLRLGKHPAVALELLRRAVARSPDRADLTWLYAQACQQSATCNPAPLERRLRELDPANGAGWLAALGRATSSGDEDATKAAFSALARAERVDIYWTTLVGRLSDVAGRAGELSLPSALTVIIGQLAATLVPAYRPVTQACSDERLHRAEVLESCRAIAAAFGRGDASVTEMMGAVITKQVWPADSEQWKQADEARRIQSYHMLTLAQSDRWASDPAAAEQYIRRLLEHRREQDVYRAAIIANGNDPDPPETSRAQQVPR